MALPTSPISLLDLQDGYGMSGAAPISMSEYYAGGSYVGAGSRGGTFSFPIPSSDTISMSNFQGANPLVVYYTGSPSITYVGSDTVLTFTGSGSFHPVGKKPIQALVVGGGGGSNGAGNYQTAAGGGGGASYSAALPYESNYPYGIVVGAGAVGVLGQISPIIYGGTSQIGVMLVASGGATAYNTDNNAANSIGGSSGNGYSGSGYGGSGSGGGAGGNASGTTGGPGLYSSISGSGVYYGGGGGPNPGVGGGGTSKAYGQGAGTNGTNGLGGGGGGTGGYGGPSNGGSGVVIIRGPFVPIYGY